MTSSAVALADVLAAEGGFQAPTIEEFYPEPLVSFSILGIDFEITRITIILWIATAAIVALLVAAVRKPEVVPGKLQFLGESGYSLVRDGMARDVIGPKGLPFAPFLGALFFFILANNAMSIIPFAQISPNSKFAIPLVLAVIVWILYNWVGIREQGAGKYFKDASFLPGRADRCADPGDADRAAAGLHHPAVHAGRPALRQHVRRPHAAGRLLPRRDLPVHPRAASLRSSASPRSPWRS